MSSNCTFLDARGARSSGCVPPCQAPGASSNCFSGIGTSSVSGTKGGQSWTFFSFLVVCA
ncbi:MAG TPA: hypothetical protein VFZ17_02425 [Acidimicrobiia bacterium]|nr:hypothetical protein [Acidimicrobiia bacterium]